MSESTDDLILTPRTRFLKSQAARYEAAWQAAIRGGEPPRIGDYLDTVDEPERPRVLSELQRIERTYRVRLSFGEAETIATEVAKSDPEPQSNETFVVKPDSSAESAEKPPPTEDRTAPGPVEAPTTPDPSLATLRLPGTFPEPSVDSHVFDPSAADSSSIHLPLLDSWGNSIEAPPIAGTLRSIVGPRPFLKGYEIIGELGRGGMGVVYQANQQGLNRLVAIKMVLGGDHAREEDLARFKVEAEAVASIQHPNIVQIYEVGEKDGTPYFSLEYINGGTLHQRIDGKPLPHGEAASIAHQLAEAMAHFHERGVIHRDLKPANVLMTLQGVPKITDFGLAKRLEGNSSQTRTGSLMGTPSYMAPEQASGDTRAIGPLSDLYSLGAVLYEMLTGRPPFQGATMLDTIDQVRSQEPVPPRRLQPKIPRDLETICLKCLQKEPSKRYADATELASDFGRFLDGEPIKARPIGRLEHGWRWVRRNPRVAFLSTSLLLLGIMMIGLAVIMGLGKVRETQTINDARLIANDRLERGRRAIETGDVRQAVEIVGVPDPFVERTPRLVEVRDKLRELRFQIQTFADFRRLLDLARNAGFQESDRKPAKSREYFREVLTFYDEIESRKGRGEFGLPPLSDWQLQLFKEDVFDTFLIAALLESDQNLESKDPEARKAAARVALNWLDRAEKLLPPTRALHSRRVHFRELIGDKAGAESDRKLAESIEPNSPVDLFWRAAKHRLSAETAIRSKQIPEAIKSYGLARDVYSRHLQARPDHYWGYIEWANCHYRLGNLADAMVGYSWCVKLNPDVPWPYHNRATIHAESKEFEDAVSDETAAISRDPDYVDAYLGRSRAYQNLGEYVEAIADLNRAFALSAPTPELIYQRAQLHFGAKQYEAALADFEATVKAFPNVIGLNRDTASTRFMLHDFEGALANWRTVAKAFPKDFQARYYIGAIEMGRRHYDEAIRAFDECLALMPDYVLATLAKARIEHWRGDNSAALKDVNQVVDQIDASNWDSKTKISYLIERIDLYRSLGRLDDAEADARRSIAIEPKQIDAYLSMALIERTRGKPEAAVQSWYDAMLKANPDSPDAHLRMAEFLRDHGHWDESIAEINRARTLDKDRGPTRADLIAATVLAARGEFQRAIREADAALARTVRPDASIHYEAACVWSLASRAAAQSGDEATASLLASRAATLLKTTLTDCFHELDFPEKDRMKFDPAIEPIVNRPDVRKLLWFQP